MARLHARPPPREVRPVRDRAGHEPVSRARSNPPRARAVARDDGGRLAASGGARQAAPREDVGAGRGRTNDAPAPGPVAPRDCVARGPIPGLARGVRAEQCARDRLDACRCFRNERGTNCGALLHSGPRGSQHRRGGGLRTRGASPGCGSGIAPDGCTFSLCRGGRSRRRPCPVAGLARCVLPSRQPRDALLRRGLAAVDLPQGHDERRSRRLVGDHRLPRIAAGPRGSRRGSRATRRRA